jgi:hypothetical protein
VEAVRYHDKRGKVTANETILLRNADLIDHLGFAAFARDFSKQPHEMIQEAVMLNNHRKEFAALLELGSAIRMAATPIKDLDLFLSEFEQEAFADFGIGRMDPR